jgi:peptidoglycan/xylan/chitin deacetylase (PgdA/CDA1 family)
VVSVTFDNLGEAAEIQLGAMEGPKGGHPSVTEVLPRLLELLERLDLPATFFVEGLNAEVYPDALGRIAAGGHEVAVHAWCHEEWGGLAAEAEAELLVRATEAMRSLGISPRGFRPPGGRVTEQTPRLLREHGYRYYSPAGSRAGVADGLAVLPFRWPLVDAYYSMPHFGGLRELHGDSPDPLTPADMRAAMLAALDAHVDPGAHLALLFHPFLVGLGGDEAFTATADVLARVRELRDAGRLGVGRMDDAAESLLAAPAGGAVAPELDTSTWTGSGR